MIPDTDDGPRRGSDTMQNLTPTGIGLVATVATVTPSLLGICSMAKDSDARQIGVRGSRVRRGVASG